MFSLLQRFVQEAKTLTRFIDDDLMVMMMMMMISKREWIVRIQKKTLWLKRIRSEQTLSLVRTSHDLFLAQHQEKSVGALQYM